MVKSWIDLVFLEFKFMVRVIWLVPAKYVIFIATDLYFSEFDLVYYSGDNFVFLFQLFINITSLIRN